MIHLFISSFFSFFLTRVYLIQMTVLIRLLYGFDFDFICHVQPLVAHELKIYLFIL